MDVLTPEAQDNLQELLIVGCRQATKVTNLDLLGSVQPPLP
jgi:hypothetical protein